MVDAEAVRRRLGKLDALVHGAIRNQLDAFGEFAGHVLRELERT